MRFCLYCIVLLLIGAALQKETVSAQEIEGSVPILAKEEGLFEAGGFCKCINYLKKEAPDPEVVTSILIQAQNIGNEQDKDAVYRAYLNNPHIDSECIHIILEERYDMKSENEVYTPNFWESFFKPSFICLRKERLADLSPGRVVEKAMNKYRKKKETRFSYKELFFNSDSQFDIERFAQNFGIEDGF